MQPYFFPYVGYFQLIAASDKFVIYDNIKFTKKGWINRNRFLLNGVAATFSIPLVRNSDYLDVAVRKISPEYQRGKLIRQFRSAYQRAPCFEGVFPLIEKIINFESDNLFEYIHHSVEQLCRHLEIETEIIISSDIPIDHNLKGQRKVLALCRQLDADEYINPIGGLELYSREEFQVAGVNLKFINTKPTAYPQNGAPFVPNLSIIDMLMFNSLDQVKQWVRRDYDLI